MKKPICLLVAFLPGLAWAHTGHHGMTFWAGALHLFSGFDHLLVLVAAGLSLAAVQRQQDRLAGCLAVGAAVLLGMFAAPLLPTINMEPAVSATLIITGGMVALALNGRLTARLTTLAAVAAIHGFTHGQEMASPLSAYATGLALSSVVIMVLAMLGARRVSGQWLIRLIGAGIAVGGVALLGV